jgi:hypothetical protein
VGERILAGRPEGRSLERPELTSEDNIKMDLQELGSGFIWLRTGTIGRFL